MSKIPKSQVLRARPASATGIARDEAGATSIEYALLASLIAVTIAGVCGALFSKLSVVYGEIAGIFG
jgi:Flp pilus assembly pilin Flp